MKSDERELLRRLVEQTKDPNMISFMPFQIAELIGMHPKRLHYLCEKWIDKGWLECGVSARTGWLTDVGAAALDVDKLP